MKRAASFLASTAATLVLASTLVGCTDAADPYEGETVKGEDGKADSSAIAVFLDFTFEAKVQTDSAFNETGVIQDQLLYLVGELNGLNSVGRVDKAQVTVTKREQVNGKTQLTYKAVLPVAWGKRTQIPTSVDLVLPLDISSAGAQAFADKYKHDCVDFGAHDVDAGSMFYYFRPKASACRLTDDSISKFTASVSPSASQTTGKFPEYNKIWEDNTLNVVAIFGKYEDGATSGSDSGIAAFNQFVGSMKTELGATGVVSIPAVVPNNPGVGTPDIEFTATRADGKKVHVLALLTDNVDKGLSEPAFRARYEAATPKADFIVYNGHAGLGTNIRSLANRGKWVAGQYVIVYMNGCDSFAYIDGALNNAHKTVNADDTTGTKYIDTVVNSLPAFFASMSGATMAMYRGLMSYDAPQTYEQIFKNVDSSQVVLVTGEGDNTFTPGAGGTPTAWSGIRETGVVVKKNESKKWATPTLAAGTYEFALTGTGDADLYVRIGAEPTATKYDCRPYKTGSNESCTVTLAQPSKINAMVSGYAATSNFDIVARKL